MTDNATLEEIEARLAECDEGRRDVLTGGYGVRLLEICREQGARIQALEDAANSVLTEWDSGHLTAIKEGYCMRLWSL